MLTLLSIFVLAGLSFVFTRGSIATWLYGVLLRDSGSEVSTAVFSRHPWLYGWMKICLPVVSVGLMLQAAFAGAASLYFVARYMGALFS
jgi:hypothetical protein